MKKITTLTILATLILTGCQTQDGGMQVHVVKWDNNGLRIGTIETNGSQVAIGENANKANERFNETIKEENAYNHEEKTTKDYTSLTKELAKQGRPTSEIETLTKNFLARK